jgi:hypothetical protein
MHRSETRESTTCADCGAEISSSQRVYAFGQESALCWECAVRRGGSYDETHDRWVEAPSTAGLARDDT